PVAAPRNGFDATAVWTLFDGRLDRIRSAWAVLETTLPGYVAALGTASAANDWPEVAKRAHAIAGSTSNFGARELVATSRLVEELARRGNGSAAAAELVVAQANAFLASMAEWLELLTTAVDRPDGGR